MSTPSSDTAAIRAVIRGLRADGHELAYVDDGGERVIVRNETEAVEAITAVDDALLFVRTPGTVSCSGWVRFVMGNDPEEVVCDYTMSLDASVSRVTDTWE